jgi:pantoate kinase
MDSEVFNKFQNETKEIIKKKEMHEIKKTGQGMTKEFNKHRKLQKKIKQNS